MNAHTRHRTLCLFALLVVAAGTAMGCGSRQRSGDDEQTLAPAPIRPATVLDYDFMWRQEVIADWGERSQSFEAVLQKVGSQLSLVGLSPAGRPGFQLTEENGEISFENLSNREFPFEAAYILADIQCAFYPWVDDPPADGEAGGSIDGFHVVETRSAGRPTSRLFTRDDAPERGMLTVTYTWGDDAGSAPLEVVLVSEWYGYTLTIRTFEQMRL